MWKKVKKHKKWQTSEKKVSKSGKLVKQSNKLVKKQDKLVKKKNGQTSGKSFGMWQMIENFIKKSQISEKSDKLVQ